MATSKGTWFRTLNLSCPDCYTSEFHLEGPGLKLLILTSLIYVLKSVCSRNSDEREYNRKLHNKSHAVKKDLGLGLVEKRNRSPHQVTRQMHHDPNLSPYLPSPPLLHCLLQLHSIFLGRQINVSM